MSTPTSRLVSATGSQIIEILTIAASSYLLHALLRHGARGKLRVRLLVGMVVSDLLLGLVACMSTIAYLSNHPLITDTPACDAAGFFLTSILFTQHMWTMVIAIATYMILIYPLNSHTMWMERHWWSIPVIIWGFSFIHSGFWYRYKGFSSNGPLCYYALDDDGGQLPRDLMQFIPRAFVFILVIALYSRLFRFLRRPDTIQVSTEDNTPSPTPRSSTSPITGSSAWGRKSFLQANGGTGAKEWEMGEVVEEVPPWEKLHINLAPGLLAGEGGRGSVSFGGVEMVGAQGERNGSGDSGTTKVDPVGYGMGRDVRFSVSGPEEGGFMVLPYPATSSSYLRTGESIDPILPSTPHPSDPSPRPDSPSSDSISDTSTTYDPRELGIPGKKRKKSGQTLQEFFAQHQATRQELEESGRGGVESGQGGEGGERISAASYFNRQASLLMLYFPLAYLVVFVFSLVRLAYDMITQEPNVVLSILSSWMVLSVGLVDALVYGLAEYMVKRRVRRKMPQHRSFDESGGREEGS